MSPDAGLEDHGTVPYVSTMRELDRRAAPAPRVSFLMLTLVISLLTACATEIPPPGSPAASPIPLLQPSPSVATACDPGDVELGLLIAATPEDRLRCIGGRTITLSGVIIESFGAGGCPGEQVPGEGWLRPCVQDGVLVAPGPGAADALLVLLHPDLGLRPDALPVNQPVTITGHFDDPAAQDCRILVGHRELSDPDTIERCREQFVATQVATP